MSIKNNQCVFGRALALFCLATTAIYPVKVIEPIKVEHHSHYPLISGETFRAISDFVFDRDVRSMDPTLVKDGDKIFVHMFYLKEFLQEVFPYITAKFILITAEGVGVIDDNYITYLDSPNLIAWFSQTATLKHSKLQCIPLGICYFNLPSITASRELVKRKLRFLRQNFFFREKPLHTYLNVRTTDKDRYQVIDFFKTQDYCLVQKPVPFKEYLQDLSNSRFVISPHGHNLDCFRTWETLIAGSIPVVERLGIEEMFDDLPVIIVDDFSQVSKEFLDQEFEKMKGKTFNLDKLHADYWLKKINSIYSK